MASDFIVDNPVKADWAIEKIRRHYEKILQYEKLRDDFIKEYKSRIAVAEKNCESDCADHYNAISDLKALLHEYAVTNLPDGKRTLKFPQGSLSFKKRQPKFLVKFADNPIPSADNKALIDNLIFFGKDEFLQKREIVTVDWAALKKSLQVDESGEICDENGEVLPFIEAEFQPDKFEVKFGDGVV